MNITAIQTTLPANHTPLSVYEAISHVANTTIDVTQKMMTIFLRIIALPLLAPVLGACHLILFTRVIFKMCKENFQRKTQACDHLFTNCSTHTVADKKKNMVVLTATGDWNNAFAIEKPCSKELSSIYEIQRAKVTTISDIISALEKVPKEQPIDSLWINAHGLDAGMFLGVKRWEDLFQWVTERGLTEEDDPAKIEPFIQNPECPILCKKNVHLLNKLLQEKISSNGTIVLHSCSTGDEKDNTCIAREISKIAHGRTVYAPTKPTYGFEVTSLAPLSVKFREKETYYDIVRDNLSDIVKRVFIHTFRGNPLYAYSDECTATFIEKET